MFRALFHNWLENAAKAEMRNTVVRAAREGLEDESAARPTPADEPKSCRLGFVFALGIESGGLEDLMQGVVSSRAGVFPIREGGLSRRRAAVILSGAGEANARRAAELLIDGHRPRRVVSAGFAGALSPSLKRNDILVPDRLLKLDASGGASRSIEVETPAELASIVVRHGARRGALLTVGGVVRSPDERCRLFELTGALAVDMETFAVAEACAARQIPFTSIRVVNDLADERLPRDVERLLSQRTAAARLGAALGALWRRPASAKELYLLRENALVASDRLARFLADWAEAM